MTVCLVTEIDYLFIFAGEDQQDQDLEAKMTKLDSAYYFLGQIYLAGPLFYFPCQHFHFSSPNSMCELHTFINTILMEKYEHAIQNNTDWYKTTNLGCPRPKISLVD